MDFQKRVYIEIKRFGVHGKLIKHFLDYKKLKVRRKYKKVQRK